MPLRDMGREQVWMLPPTLDELFPLECVLAALVGHCCELNYPRG